jgi:uncharacterized peroxidase-related enzyme
MSAPKPILSVEAEPFIPYVPEQEVDARLRPRLDAYKKRMGFLPNALRLYAHRPEIAEALWDLNDRVMRDPSSTLDRSLKRRLGAVASKVNGCTYCTAHHCAILKARTDSSSEGWGMDDDEVRQLLTGDPEPKDEIEAVCFEYVRAASLDPTAVPQELLDRLNQHLTPPQIVELACVIGFWKLYNTIHDCLKIPVEADLLAQTGYVRL